MQKGNIRKNKITNKKVLIACEESQTVCKAFREKGYTAKERSKTFTGIANAMAEQWG